MSRAPTLPGEVAGRFGPGSEINRQESQYSRVPKTEVPGGGCAMVMCVGTATEITTWFDTTGRGRDGRKWQGWAIANGQNGTDDYRGVFPRFSVVAALGTGGSDSSAHIHDDGTLAAAIKASGGAPGSLIFGPSGANFTPTQIMYPGASAGYVVATPGTDVYGNTGPASATDNRPAYKEVVPVVKL